MGLTNKRKKDESRKSLQTEILEQLDAVKDATAEALLLAARIKQKVQYFTFADDFQSIVAHLEKIRDAANHLERLAGAGTILVVDDDEQVRTGVARTLGAAGYSVLTAANAREARELYAEKEKEISLVVLDLLMPEVSGYSLLQTLLRINPGLKVIVMGEANQTGPDDVLEAGAVALVKKPLDPDQLLDAVRQFVQS